MDSGHPLHYFVGDTRPALGNEVVVICGKKLRIRDYMLLQAAWGVPGTCPDCFRRPQRG